MRSYPFSAVVGSDDMRLAPVLTTISPAIGGVLVRGEKGTAKSTTVRALAELLPPQDVVAGCRFGCDPASPDPGCPDGPHAAGADTTTRPARLVELPVGATEDRVIGSLDLEQALGAGQVRYEPGLLADANRGILYVDEVNLLHDHLVDLLLDAAAMGRASVERDGVSMVVDASGSMAARHRMEAVKTAVLSLLLDAYQRRDKVGLITFRGQHATLALPPTTSVDAAARRLEELPSPGTYAAGRATGAGRRGAAPGTAPRPATPPAAAGRHRRSCHCRPGRDRHREPYDRERRAGTYASCRAPHRHQHRPPTKGRLTCPRARHSPSPTTD